MSDELKALLDYAYERAYMHGGHTKISYDGVIYYIKTQGDYIGIEVIGV